jgi:hypothetical protein
MTLSDLRIVLILKEERNFRLELNEERERDGIGMGESDNTKIDV